MKNKFLTGILVFQALQISNLQAQEPINDAPAKSLFVFLDCNARNCDFDHFRRQIPWVNWVRDMRDSDIHLLITFQRTGGGGFQYTLDYIGRKSRLGTEKSLQFVSDPNSTDAEVRDQLTNTMALGLIQFVDNIPEIASKLKINYDNQEAGEQQIDVDRQEDPWNLWVFRLSSNFNLEGESSQRGYSIRGEVSARRISEDLKLEFETGGRYRRNEFDDVDEGETIINISENYYADALAVWSLGPQWSFGTSIGLSRSTFSNRDLAIFAGPVVEYNFFPYSESTRRIVVLRYGPQVAAFDYELITVEGKTSETLARHSLALEAEIQQPWGEIDAFIEGIQYLHDPSTHRINTFLRVEYRLFRGFNVDIFAFWSRIKDQFFLPAEGLTPEEVLLQRRQRETDFRFDLGIGFSYRFGSKYANVVNPRIN